MLKSSGLQQWPPQKWDIHPFGSANLRAVGLYSLSRIWIFLLYSLSFILSNHICSCVFYGIYAIICLVFGVSATGNGRTVNITWANNEGAKQGPSRNVATINHLRVQSLGRPKHFAAYVNLIVCPRSHHKKHITWEDEKAAYQFEIMFTIRSAQSSPITVPATNESKCLIWSTDMMHKSSFPTAFSGPRDPGSEDTQAILKWPSVLNDKAD